VLRVSKLVHATVLVEEPDAGVRLLVDPGTMFPVPADTFSALDAVLFTHRHADHFDPRIADRFAGPVYGPASLAGALEAGSDRLVGVSAGDEVRIGPIAITVHGSTHEPSHPDHPPVVNHSYLIDHRVLVTGDALVEVACDVLLAPVDAPWLTVPALLDYLRRLNPQRFLGVHDGLLSPAGLGVIDDVLDLEQRRSGRERRRLADNRPVGV